MSLVILLIKACVGSLDGVEFSSDGKTLLSTPVKLIDYTIPSSCEIIFGGDSPLKSSFVQCKNFIKSIKDSESSQLKCIYPYVFKESTIESVDLHNSIHLESINYSVFSNCVSLKTVLLPEGMKTICSGAFYYCTQLFSINIPNSITVIQGWHPVYQSPFQLCGSLKRIDISPQSQLTDILNDAFSYTGLESIYIPANLQHIETAIFATKITQIEVHPDNRYFSFDGKALFNYENTTLYYFIYNEGIEYTVPKSVNIIGGFGFRRNKITKITFQSEISFISSFCFESTNLKEFIYPEGPTSINNYTFFKSQNLETVVLSSKITKIHERAFSKCYKLSNITLNNIIDEIGDYAFSECSSLVKFDCPVNLVTFGSGVFSGCEKLEFNSNGNSKFNVVDKILYVDGIYAKEYFGSGGSVTIPETCKEISDSVFASNGITSVTINSNQELKIGKKAFYGSEISTIDLPQCLTEMSEECFGSIKTLETVTINSLSNLKIIPLKCFLDCPNLVSITLPSGLTTIEDHAFLNCASLKTIDLYNTNLHSIGKRSFEKTDLESVKVPSTLMILDEQAFQFSNITEINMKECNVEIINEGAFQNCALLSNVIFSDETTSINSFSFKGCVALTEIELPLHILFVRMRSFEGCVKLEKLKLKLNCDLDTIAGEAFKDCISLQYMCVDPNDSKFVAVDGVLMNKNKTTLIIFLPGSPSTIFVVPATIQKIGNYAFQNCVNLRTIAIPEGDITTVGYHCFEGCKSLSSMFLPPTLVDFGEGAFLDCPSLKCGSVSYPHANITKAIEAGIPEIAFETKCPSIRCITLKGPQYRRLFDVAISMLCIALIF